MRYEDLSTRPESMVALILDFVGLSVTDSVKKFVAEHTKLSEHQAGRASPKFRGHGLGPRRQKPVGAYSTFRNSRSTAFEWRNHFNYSTVARIQSACSHSIKLLNLRLFKSAQEYRDESLSVLLPD